MEFLQLLGNFFAEELVVMLVRRPFAAALQHHERAILPSANSLGLSLMGVGRPPSTT